MKSALLLKQIALNLKEGKEFTVDNDTLISIYEGHTLFSIFSIERKLYQYIAEQLKTSKFEDEIDSAGNVIQNNFLRKLAQVMNTPTVKNIYETPGCVKCKKKRQKDEKYVCPKCQGFLTVCQKSIYLKNDHLRDLLLQICMHCKDFDVT